MRRSAVSAKICAAVIATLGLWLTACAEEETFSPYVSEDGSISLPKDYRSEFVFLGTWSIAGEEEESGAVEFHNVYTQKGIVEGFQETGEFPDGTVLVKELLSAETGDFTTGHVSYGAGTNGWFVMVKDTQGRFEGNPLWGDGRGWSLFYSDDPDTTVTTGYKTAFLPCHIPAKDTDWTYVQGYPALNREQSQ